MRQGEARRPFVGYARNEAMLERASRMNHEVARNMGKGLRRCQSVGRSVGGEGRLVASSHIAHSGSVRAKA